MTQEVPEAEQPLPVEPGLSAIDRRPHALERQRGVRLVERIELPQQPLAGNLVPYVATILAATMLATTLGVDFDPDQSYDEKRVLAWDPETFQVMGSGLEL